MKRNILLAAIVIACGTMVLTACNDDKLGGDSIFPTTAVKRNTFDQWLYKNYTMPYNIEFQYRLKTEETDKAYNFVPADSAKTAKLAIITKYMWFDAYAETVGLDFVKENVPRIIVAVGIPGYTRYRTEVVGSAEGGYKVTLSKVNALTDDLLKDYGSMTGFYFHTMHHEFMHILNQKKPYDESFDDISRADYVSGNWTSVPEKQASRRVLSHLIQWRIQQRILPSCTLSTLQVRLRNGIKSCRLQVQRVRVSSIGSSRWCVNTCVIHGMQTLICSVMLSFVVVRR